MCLSWENVYLILPPYKKNSHLHAHTWRGLRLVSAFIPFFRTWMHAVLVCYRIESKTHSNYFIILLLMNKFVLLVISAFIILITNFSPSSAWADPAAWDMRRLTRTRTQNGASITWWVYWNKPPLKSGGGSRFLKREAQKGYYCWLSHFLSVFFWAFLGIIS